MSVTHSAPMRYVRIILNRIDLRAPDTFIRQQRSSGGAAAKAHLLLDCDPQILHEMEPISDLTSLRRTLASSLCVQPASVSAHDLDRRMLLQPSRDTRYAPVLKNIDNRTALQVDDHRAVAPRSPPAPIIYANDPDRGIAGNERGIPLQLPQDRVVADRHAEPSHQALAGPAAGAMAEQTDNLGDPACPARIRGSNRRQSVGERLSFTFLMRAPPAAQPKLHRYGLALDRLQRDNQDETKRQSR
ncbi:hypothetical protein ACVI1N_000049 [Sinorhizobium medicae]